MFSKKTRSALSALLAFILVFTACFALLPAPAAEATTQAEIDSLQSQRDSIKQQQNELQSTISSLKSKQYSTIELKTALDQKNTLTLQQIQNLEEQIDLHTTLIKQKTEELKDAQAVADAHFAKYKVRLRNMEENGKYSYIEVLFGANSISEFLSLIDDIGDIIKSDKELENSYRKAITDLSAVKAEYENAKEELQAKNTELKALNVQLEKDIAEATALINSLQGDINSNSQQLADLADQGSKMDSKIAAMTKKLAEEARQRELEKQRQEQGSTPSNPSTPVIATGSLMWPSYTTSIASPYGYRIHPIYGTYKLHGGVDIGASYGTAIWAADSGKVVTSQDGWNGGWGNYVMIDHGNGVQTLYAHMSSRAVSVGQSVSKGQVIGYVGSTGASTGPHLHFEVWNYGSRVDPMSYFR